MKDTSNPQHKQLSLLFVLRGICRCLACTPPRKRAKKMRVCVVCVLVPIMVVILYNILMVVWIFGGLRNDYSFTTPHRSGDPSVRLAVSRAYGNGWVGFPELPPVKCRELVTKSRFRLSWYLDVRVNDVTNQDFIRDAANCSHFRHKYGYPRYRRASIEELEFPLAYSILFHQAFHQVHILLRAIYHPHNVYCLSPDLKADPSVLAAARAVSECLPNVFVSKRREKIVYQGFSRLVADLHCLKALLRHKVQWKYAMNLPGQQFPLRTNLETVRILKMFRGANDVEGKTGLSALEKRYKRKHVLVYNEEESKLEMKATREKHTAPPHGLTMVKGSAYNTLSKAFVHFVLTDPRVKDFLEWNKHVLSPDEYFWATINHNPSLKAPGGYFGIPNTKPHLTSFAIWRDVFPCASRFVRDICILSPGDMPLLMSRHEFTANKFYIDHYPQALHCLDQYIFNKSVTGFLSDMSIYKHLTMSVPSSNE